MKLTMFVVLAVLFLSGTSGISLSSFSTTGRCAYYSSYPTAEDITTSTFLFPHADYDQEWWYYVGHLLDSVGGNHKGFEFNIIRHNLLFHTNWAQGFLGNMAYSDPQRGYYEGACYSLGLGIGVTFDDPFKLSVSCYGGYKWTVSLEDGDLGQPGATYHLQGSIEAKKKGTNQTAELSLDITLLDKRGPVSEGYGPKFFSMKWLTTEQRRGLTQTKTLTSSTPENHMAAIRSYLAETQDPFMCQGSYYFSQPLMKIVSYKVGLDGNMIDQGNNGWGWFDKEISSTDAATKPTADSAFWTWISAQFPDVGLSMMMFRLNSTVGVLKTARIFGTTGVEPIYDWPEEEIEFINYPQTWTSVSTQTTYPVRWNITLGSDVIPQYKGYILVLPIMPNQEFDASPVSSAYWEGAYVAQAFIGGKVWKGYGYLEMVYTSANGIKAAMA